MKYIFGFFFIFVTTHLFSQTYTSQLVVDFDERFVNKNLQILDEQSVIYNQLIKDTILVLNYEIEEPKFVKLFIEDGSADNIYPLYISKIKDTIRIDDYIYFKNSELNEEFYRLFEPNDRLSKLYYQLKFKDIDKKTCTTNNKDSVSIEQELNKVVHLLIKQYEVYYETHPASYLTLEQVRRGLNMNLENQSFAIKLFYQLDKSQHKYPSYQYCKSKIEAIKKDE